MGSSVLWDSACIALSIRPLISGIWILCDTVLMSLEPASYHLSRLRYFRCRNWLGWCLYWFARAVVTKNHKLSGLNNRNLLSHSSGGQTSETKVSAGLFPSEGHEEESSLCFSFTFCGVLAISSIPGLVYLCLHLHIVVFLCVCLRPNFPFFLGTQVMLD